MIFIDRVTFWSALQLLVSRAVGSLSSRHRIVYCLEGRISRCWPLVVLNRVYRTRVVDCEYALSEVVEPDGGGVVLRSYSRDCNLLTGRISKARLAGNPIFRNLCARFVPDRILLYFRKRLFFELMDPLRRIHVAAWQHRQSRASYCTLYAQSILWKSELERFAKRLNVRVVWYTEFHLAGIQDLAGKLSRIRRIIGDVYNSFGDNFPSRSGTAEAPSVEQTIAVNYDGKGLTLDLSKNSDLFWVPLVDRRKSRVLTYFHRPDDPLDSKKATYLRQHNLDYAVWYGSGAVDGFSEHLVAQNHPLFLRLSFWLIARSLGGLRMPRTSYWLLLNSIHFLRTYVKAYISYRARNVKILIGYGETPERTAMDQAVHDVGGISVGYQRSAIRLAGPAWWSSSHVQFLFSSSGFQTELLGGSNNRYLIASGYTHDYAFSRVRDRAIELRNRLGKAGAGFVICFFDENSFDDVRVGSSNLASARDYIFLCTRLLEDGELGLILKPKKPADLRARIGPHIGNLLDKALDTGRCILIEEGIVSTPTLPCEVALAADAAVGLLLGSTAALESRLVGTPTVLLDRDHLIDSPLRRPGIVFEDWESLWPALLAIKTNAAACKSVGEWSPIIERLDSYRDGRAAERIAGYLDCFLEALQEGQDRDTALERCARVYEKQWGQEHVLPVGNALSKENRIG